jgi:hypothetical protein
MITILLIVLLVTLFGTLNPHSEASGLPIAIVLLLIMWSLNA